MGILALVAGCSTPQSRIQRDPAAFARLGPEEQKLVQQGRVQLGMDRSAVELALGKPDRARSRSNEQGQTEVWIYLAREGTTRGTLYYGRGYYMPYGSPWWGAGPVIYGDNDETYPRLKVEFRGDKVTSVDQEER